MKRNVFLLLAGALVLAGGVAVGTLHAELIRSWFAPAGTGPSAESQKSGPAAAPKRRILYYRNPMGHPDTSPVPKKDSMGMDYLPVYEGEESDGGSVRVSPDRLQLLGVRTEAAATRPMPRGIRAFGVVRIDEARESVVSSRTEGWIEALAAARSGERVRKGQVLAEIYGPELVRTQLEFFINRRAGGDGGQPRADGPLFRLRNFGVAEADIESIVTTGTVRRTLPLRAPQDGVIVEKRAVLGMRSAPGETLFRIVDLAHVWMVAEVFEQDIAEIEAGLSAEATISALPGRRFRGKVTLVYPALAEATRTASVRIDLPNDDAALRPNMYGTATIEAPGAPALAVPEGAVIDTGLRRVVLVEKAPGLFEPRPVRTGRRAEGYVAILEGLAERERVVTSANFLIDSESNLKSALQSYRKSGDAPAGEEKKP